MADQPHIERIKAELAELDDRAVKLQSFIADNPIYSTLGAVKQELLKAQFDAMVSYRRILNLRLSLETAADPSSRETSAEVASIAGELLELKADDLDNVGWNEPAARDGLLAKIHSVAASALGQRCE